MEQLKHEKIEQENTEFFMQFYLIILEYKLASFDKCEMMLITPMTCHYYRKQPLSVFILEGQELYLVVVQLLPKQFQD